MDRVIHWLERIEDFFGRRGKGAWIAAFVLGFIWFWPIGLSILAYTLWSGRMGCWKHIRKNRRQAAESTGNSAFDEYREETLRRLQEEQSDFEGFMERLRIAMVRVSFCFYERKSECPGTG